MIFSIKFYGNYNPHVDAWELDQSLLTYFKGHSFSFWMDGGVSDILILINSCPVGCGNIPAFSGKLILITSEGVEHETVSEEKLLLNVIKKYRKKMTRNSAVTKHNLMRNQGGIDVWMHWML